MAQKTVVTMTDDIDGSAATQTVLFGLDGRTYEIDLNEVHAEDLREVLAPFVSVGRRVGSGTAVRVAGVSATPSPRAGGPDAKTVRAWAEANGVSVSARGRLKAETVEQYQAANG